MKILFYIDTFYKGGAQRVMSCLITQFNNLNNEIIALDDFPPDKTKPQYHLPDSVKRIHVLKTNSGNSIIKNVKRIISIRRICQQEKPDIIISFLGRPNTRMLFSTIDLNCRKIVSIRNDPNKEYGKGYLKRFFYNNLFKLADGYVFQTVDAMNYFSDKIRKKSAVIKNPVDEMFYHTQWTENSEKKIVAVGRLAKQKNHLLLIDAFREAGTILNEYVLEIYGEGPLKDELEKYIVSNGLEERVFLQGNTDRIEQILATASLFVLTSDYEGMPNALMEAMAVGTPAISTDCPCGGPRELLKGLKYKKLVKCNDRNMLAKSITEVLLDMDLQKCMSMEEKKRAESYRIDGIVAEWEKYIYIVCAGGKVNEAV